MDFGRVEEGREELKKGGCLESGRRKEEREEGKEKEDRRRKKGGKDR